MRAISVTGDRGFTLLELMVVLAILVLIASAWPLASSHVFAAQRVRNEAQQLAGALRVGEMTARITGTAQELQLSAQGASYRIGIDSHSLPDGMTLHLRPGRELTSATPLVFYPDGSSSGGILDLLFHDRLATVQVQPMTGRLELSP